MASTITEFRVICAPVGGYRGWLSAIATSRKIDGHRCIYFHRHESLTDTSRTCGRLTSRERGAAIT
jgi:hypothetical protein